MPRARPAAVAGYFYPAGTPELARTVRELLAEVPADVPGVGVVKVLVAPHAGYSYSGPVAASGFARFAAQAAQISTALV